MNTVIVLFPNTLFHYIAPLRKCDGIILIEEFLFFKLYKFHKQKLIFHRASMKAYEDYLLKEGLEVEYVDTSAETSDIRILIPFLKTTGVTSITMFDPCDEWLEKRTRKACREIGISLEFLENPLFINSMSDLSNYKNGRRKYFQADFYIHQRTTRNILLDAEAGPLNGKWSFDQENRAKYPAGKKPPTIKGYASAYHEAAAIYVQKHFATNYGEIDADFYMPVDHAQAAVALDDFLNVRFKEFGIYEDSIIEEETHLNHSVLSALMNTGLLLPGDVISKAIDYGIKHKIPYNSIEGFVRQVLGWREFVRMIYNREGNRQRTQNFWKFKRKIPRSFYDASTGIKPVDATIRKLSRSAYNHHIERLMILSNFMLLCEFDPDEVYRWFMEMYIDAYDWVMVPNVYGMGQFADGGLMCTKPYISGSNYIFKMSNYKKGEDWAETWDALFWRFMHVHRSFFLQNPRLGMLVKTFDRWDRVKQQAILKKAEAFLEGLDRQE